MDKIPDGERLATLESNDANHASKITELTTTVAEINKNVGLILVTMAGQKGFFHGVVFTLSVLGGIVGASLAEIWHKVAG
jgi:hypothetical protein